MYAQYIIEKKYQLKLPILYHHIKSQAIIARPPDRIQSLLTTLQQQQQQSTSNHFQSSYIFSKEDRLNEPENIYMKKDDVKHRSRKKKGIHVRDVDSNKRWHEGPKKSGKYYDHDKSGFDWSHVDFVNYDQNKPMTGKSWSILDRNFTYDNNDDNNNNNNNNNDQEKQKEKEKEKEKEIPIPSKQKPN